MGVSYLTLLNIKVTTQTRSLGLHETLLTQLTLITDNDVCRIFYICRIEIEARPTIKRSQNEQIYQKIDTCENKMPHVKCASAYSAYIAGRQQLSINASHFLIVSLSYVVHIFIYSVSSARFYISLITHKTLFLT